MTQPATPLLSEPGPTRVLKVICIFVCVLSAGCGRHEPPPNNSSAANSALAVAADQSTNQSDWQYEQRRRDALAKAMADSEKDYEEKLLHPPTNKVIFLPNYQAGPLNPRPIHVNFYAINDHYQTYLLCQYDVDEKNYDQSGESGWFQAALKQIRKLGPQKFPPFKWVAVIISNRAEHKDASTFEQCHKVGAIFKAGDVFDSSSNLSKLIAGAEMDRHPFKYDTTQPTPGEQQRWVIVERHATNNPTTRSH
jgi:hypothetical protein